jgi:hypothetical protein
MPPPGMKSDAVNPRNVTTHKAEIRHSATLHLHDLPVQGVSDDKHFDRMKFYDYQ